MDQYRWAKSWPNLLHNAVKLEEAVQQKPADEAGMASTGCNSTTQYRRCHSLELPVTRSQRAVSEASSSKTTTAADVPSPTPSMAAASLMGGWRRNSVKKCSSKSNNGVENGGGGQLSQMSQEMLAQIIRLFPFPERPKLSRTLSQPVDCAPCSSSSSVSLLCPADRNSVKAVTPEEREGDNEESMEAMARKMAENCNGNEQHERVHEHTHATSPPRQQPQRLRYWHSKASEGLGRLRRAASNLSGGVGAGERPRHLPLFGGDKPAKASAINGGALMRLCRVSVDTMAITALPLECWLKERLKNWVQLSGHANSIVPASNHTLWKRQPAGSNEAEAKAYMEIMRDPALHGVTPKFYREIMHKNDAFIEIQDLLAEFPNTSDRAIMDIKIGTRTFLEAEVSNGKKRADLYQKMVELAPEEPTQQEHSDGAVTKLRYMQFRERKSSSAALGFRIEAAQLPGGTLRKDFKRVCTRPEVRHVLDTFFGEHKTELHIQLLVRLRQIRTAVESSTFFGNHEVVGSSLLIVHDEKRVGAWLIDFAKCTHVEGARLTHRRAWELGNHEDGYLTGLDNLVQLLEEETANMDVNNELLEDEIKTRTETT